MVRARAASHSGVRIPFGAAHRVDFDTPPLKGRCLALTSASKRCARNPRHLRQFRRTSASKRRAGQEVPNDGGTL